METIPTPPQAPPRRRGLLWTPWAAFALAWAGQRMVAARPSLALGLWAAAALLLLPAFWRSPQGTLQAPAPRLGWEPLFVAALLSLLIWTRFSQLGSLPEGAINYEGEMARSAWNLAQGPYSPHDTHPTNTWPSLLHYQGWFFGKVLGLDLAGFRMVAAFWGVLSVLAFYVAVRQISSPLTAAFVSLLLAASWPHLVYGRRFHPGIQMLLPVLGGWALTVQAMRRGDPRWFAAAGAVVGLSLHGFFPGRNVIFVFGAWLVLRWALSRGREISLRQGAWFLGGYALVGLPVILWAFAHRDLYWGWILQVNPAKGQGLAGYVNQFKLNAPLYARSFHSMADPNFRDDLGVGGLLDPLGGALFTLGLMLALGSAWRLGHAFPLLLFAAGLLPAIMAGSYPTGPPSYRRALLALPAVYIFIAVAFEALRRPLARRMPAWLGAGLGLALLGYAAQLNVKAFKDYAQRSRTPEARFNHGHAMWAARPYLKRSPDAKVSISRDLWLHVGWQILLKPELQPRELASLDDALALAPGSDHLVILGPWARGSAPVFEALYPGCEVKVVADPDASYDKAPWDEPYMDPYDFNVYGVVVFVPKEAVAKRAGLILDGAAVDVNEPGFGERFAGRSVTLKGVLMGTWSGGAAEPRMAWPGWSVRIEGQPAAWERKLNVNGGSLRLELSGRVPADAKGSLPFQLRYDENPGLVPHYLAVESVGSLVAEYRGQDADFTGPLHTRRHEWGFGQSFAGAWGLRLPAGALWMAELTAPSAGRYRFRLGPMAGAKIYVDGRLVYDNLIPRAQPKPWDYVDLKAGQRFALRIEHQIDSVPDRYRSFSPRVQREGGEEVALSQAWLGGRR